MKKNVRSLSYGILVYIAFSLLASVNMYFDENIHRAIILWSGVFVSGLITAIYAETHKIVMSLVIVLPNTIIGVLFQILIWPLLGAALVDISSMTIILAVITTFVIGLIFSGMGGIFGWFISKPKEAQ